METKFTPGPWGLVVPEDRQRFWPEVWRGGFEVIIRSTSLDRAAADARLIAAAPTMYEALRNIILLDSEPEPDSLTWSIRGDQAIEAAKAALAKAEGK